MGDVIASLLKALGQLGDPAVLRVALKSVALTLAIFAGVGAAMWWTFDSMLENWLALILPEDVEGPVAAFALLFIWLIGFWLLFRVVALVVLQFFADEIVAAVEHRHYPQAAERAKALPFRQELANSLRSMGRALGYNLLALPVALVLMSTVFGPALVFLLVNAVLLGRELTDMAWLRHCEGDAKACPVGGGRRMMLGAVITAMMALPLANLIAPILGAAAGTHLTQRAMLRREGREVHDA